MSPGYRLQSNSVYFKCACSSTGIDLLNLSLPTIAQEKNLHFTCNPIVSLRPQIRSQFALSLALEVQPMVIPLSFCFISNSCLGFDPVPHWPSTKRPKYESNFSLFPGRDPFSGVFLQKSLVLSVLKPFFWVESLTYSYIVTCSTFDIQLFKKTLITSEILVLTVAQQRNSKPLDCKRFLRFFLVRLPGFQTLNAPQR